MAIGNLPSYYAGSFNVGTDPDWNRVAAAIDLLRANGIRIEAARASKNPDGTAELPFLARSGNSMERACDVSEINADPRSRIESLSPYRLSAYKRVDPGNAGTHTLEAMAKLTDDNLADARSHARDLAPVAATPDDPDEVFAGLVGLTAQRDMLRRIGTLAARRGRGAVECLHMVFSGPAGTGKTELAKRMLAYLDANGVTDGSGTFVRKAATELEGRYVGQTPRIVRAALDKARGGILFIDEAYALLAGSDFGQQAIDTLVEELEERRDEVICVIAGYPNDLERLFERNAGLRDRFALRLEFADYTTIELARIFEGMAAHHGFDVDPSARGELERCLNAMRGMPGFANARSARRLFDRTAIECTWRGGAAASITATDLRAAWAHPDLGKAASSRPRVGFGM